MTHKQWLPFSTTDWRVASCESIRFYTSLSISSIRGAPWGTLGLGLESTPSAVELYLYRYLLAPGVVCSVDVYVHNFTQKTLTTVHGPQHCNVAQGVVAHLLSGWHFSFCHTSTNDVTSSNMVCRGDSIGQNNQNCHSKSLRKTAKSIELPEQLLQEPLESLEPSTWTYATRADSCQDFLTTLISKKSIPEQSVKTGKLQRWKTQQKLLANKEVPKYEKISREMFL